jgi:hypothetical protein
MQRIKKSLALLFFLTLFSAATLVSCGKQGKEDHPAGEHPADSTEHPADSTEHPADSTAKEHPEHPEDSTKN